MKINQVIALLLLLYTSACANNTSGRTEAAAKDSAPAPAAATNSFESGKIIDSVICQSDPSQSYALYISTKSHGQAMPVIYFFDPHAAGALPLQKYKSLADEYGFILVGSNNSKNGNDWGTTETIWRCLSADIKSRLLVNPDRIYTCGFSGGAKVAGYVALQHPGIKGVIANGAGLPDGTPAGDFNFSFTAIAGEGDMNMTELVAISNDLDKSRTRHRIIFFDGKHEWAPETTMNLALAGLQFDAMREGLIPANQLFINAYVAQSRKRLDAYTQTNQLIKAGQECRLSMAFLDGLTGDANWFKEKEAHLAASAIYQQQRQAQETLLATEQNTKADYQQHFQQDDMQYWTSTISDLQAKANAKTSGGAAGQGGMNQGGISRRKTRQDEVYQREMYQRLLAYLSLAFYSISNHLINGNENAGARHFVELYKMADPTNSEAWYFSAILNAREGHSQAAENDLIKAVENGFRDENRMLQQAEFQNLSPQINFVAIKSKMHAPVKGE